MTEAIIQDETNSFLDQSNDNLNDKGFEGIDLSPQQMKQDNIPTIKAPLKNIFKAKPKVSSYLDPRFL